MNNAFEMEIDVNSLELDDIDLSSAKLFKAGITEATLISMETYLKAGSANKQMVLKFGFGEPQDGEYKFTKKYYLNWWHTSEKARKIARTDLYKIISYANKLKFDETVIKNFLKQACEKKREIYDFNLQHPTETEIIIYAFVLLEKKVKLSLIESKTDNRYLDISKFYYWVDEKKTDNSENKNETSDEDVPF